SALLADVVDGADVGMVERGSGLRFAAKTAEGRGVANHVIGKKLQGDEAMQAGLFGFVDHAHASAAELLDHLVVRDVLADHDFGDARNVRRSTQAAILGAGWKQSQRNQTSARVGRSS